MKEYRIKVQKRHRWLAAELVGILLVMAAVGAYSYFVLSREYAQSHLHGFVLGIGFGLIVALAGLLVWKMIQCAKALKSEEALRKLYIAATDERTRFINDKVGGFGYNLALGGLAVAGAAASLINPTISVTLYAALAYLALVKAVLTRYYNTKL